MKKITDARMRRTLKILKRREKNRLGRKLTPMEIAGLKMRVGRGIDVR